MTFLEAAIEVLRREGKPLAIKRLAELAVQHNLLSVVGRDPEGTMQARLDEVLDKGPTHAELFRVPPGLYGLRAYPPRPYPPVREPAEPEPIAEAPNGAPDAELDELAAENDAAAAGAGGRRGRRRRRRGRGDREGGAPAGEAVETAEASAPVEASMSEEEGGVMEPAEEPEFEVEADGASSAPLMVATAGDEELTRSGEEREVRSEILGGRRDERSRRRHEHRGRGRDRDRERDRGDRDREARPARPEGHAAPARAASPPPAPAMPVASAAPLVPGERRGLATDLVDILRANDGRPQHVRQLAQETERRKVLEGRPQPEIVREVRMALHGDVTTRTARGLRPRVRSLGGGNYAVIDRKLDDELVAAERALEGAIERHAVATAQAVRRKLARLSPFSFEQLGRSVAEALGVDRPQLVKRGDGVAYYGGERSLGAIRSRVLIGVRAGEGELGRRAVGELRAGLDARGFDEGLLVGLGRLSAEGREELRAGRAVTVYDGDSLPGLLVERRLGVRVVHAQLAYLDLEYFSEINET